MRLNKTRSAAGVIALAVGVTLAVRLMMTAQENGTSLFGAAWIDYRFFTIWTNTLVGAVCAAIALGFRVPQWLTAGAMLAIALVAGVYHALLAGDRVLVGLDAGVDLMVHTLVPAAYITLWLFALPKGQLRPRDLLIWSAYPILYSVYAIGRGLMDGTYPYFFLNLSELGAGGVALWVAGLAMVFLLAGVAVLLGARMIARTA